MHLIQSLAAAVFSAADILEAKSTKCFQEAIMK